MAIGRIRERVRHLTRVVLDPGEHAIEAHRSDARHERAADRRVFAGLQRVRLILILPPVPTQNPNTFAG